jgi:small-conductance mechanosensitive channel
MTTTTTTTSEPGLFENWRLAGEWLTHNWTSVLSTFGIWAAVALVLLGVRAGACRILGGREAVGWRRVVVGTLGRTNAFFIVMAAAKLVGSQLTLPPRALATINLLWVIAAAFQIAIWARALVLGTIEHRVGTSSEQSALGTAMGLIRALVTVAAFLIATIFVLDNAGVNVTGLVAGLGIGGIAIGLAAQGIFSDLFAALAIIFDRPFRRGDTIKVGSETQGVVENIGLKTTRIRALDGELVAYSNADLLKNRIHNYALLERRRVLMRLGLVYEIPLDVLEQVPAELQKIVETHDKAVFDRAVIVELAASSVDVELIFNVHAPDFATLAKVRHEVILQILRRFAELEIGLAYPTQTTYTAAPDGTLIMPWPPAAEERANPARPRSVSG